jgi:hypothetical protein
MQKQGRPLPVYSLAQALGADHAKAFVMTVSKVFVSYAFVQHCVGCASFFCIS